MGVMIQTHGIEQRVAALTLPGLPPGKAIIPDYNGYSILAIPRFVRALFGEQVEGARVGLAQNMGGSGGSSIVHIMEVA